MYKNRTLGRFAPASIALALLCLFVLMVPQGAYAYYDRGQVGIAAGSSSISVQTGSSVSVSVTLSPASDAQTQGCGMAECPQTCPPECTDANGQCICAGSAYTTYYPSVAATSSNGGVATAGYSGGAVQIYGVGAGSATITLTASLRQFSSASATISVVVSDPPSGTPNGSSNSSNTTNNAATGTGGQNSGAQNSGVTANPTELAQAAADANAQDVQAGDTVIEMHGTSARIAQIGSGADTIAKLKEVAGTDEQITFWHGGSLERPDYSWTFYGRDLDAAALDAFDELDLGLTVSQSGTGLVSTLLDKVDKTLVLDFAFDGALPAPAVLYIAAPSALTVDDALSLYLYDEQTGGFRHVLDGLGVESGYIAFETDHCSVWAISAENIAAIPALQVPTSADGGQGSAAASPVGLPVILVILGALLVAFIVTLVLIRARQKRSRGVCEKDAVDGNG
ncbi:MAG: hypothetical protein LBL27_02710 [Coriobacteriales bacterium]|nr:hypothetical protein [Coriobacteriales bacterium]